MSKKSPRYLLVNGLKIVVEPYDPKSDSGLKYTYVTRYIGTVPVRMVRVE